MRELVIAVVISVFCALGDFNGETASAPIFGTGVLKDVFGVWWLSLLLCGELKGVILGTVDDVGLGLILGEAELRGTLYGVVGEFRSADK